MIFNRTVWLVLDAVIFHMLTQPMHQKTVHRKMWPMFIFHMKMIVYYIFQNHHIHGNCHVIGRKFVNYIRTSFAIRYVMWVTRVTTTITVFMRLITTTITNPQRKLIKTQMQRLTIICSVVVALQWVNKFGFSCNFPIPKRQKILNWSNFLIISDMCWAHN